VRGFFCRGLRLKLVSGLGIALAAPVLAVAAESQGMATQTTLAAVSSAQDGHTQAKLTIKVLGADGQPASGTVNILDEGNVVAGAALDDTGTATTTLSLSQSAHALTASYAGDSTHRVSTSSSSEVRAMSASSATADFALSVSPATLTVKVGTSGTATLTLTPSNASSLSSPMFITVNCSTGLPDEATCTPYPSTVEILSTTTTAPTSTLTFVTNNSSQSWLRNHHPSHRAVALAMILPGALGLFGLFAGGRRRRWLSRLSLVTLFGFVTIVGAAGCNPLYSYKKHTPDTSGATATGTYTVTISGQTTDGVTATTHTTSIALVVD